MTSAMGVAKYVRFARGGAISYGLCEGDCVRELVGGFFEKPVRGPKEYPLAEVELLVPCEPTKVLAVGLNYASHRAHVEKSEGVLLTAAGKPAPSDYPVVFAKFPSSLIAH